MWVLQVLAFVLGMATLAFFFRGYYAKKIADATVEIIAEDGVFRVRRYNVNRFAYEFLVNVMTGKPLGWSPQTNRITAFISDEEALKGYELWKAHLVERQAEAEKNALKVVKKL